MNLPYSLLSGLLPSALDLHQICLTSKTIGALAGFPFIDWITAGGEFHPALRINKILLRFEKSGVNSFN
jgi:hypothetical protein